MVTINTPRKVINAMPTLSAWRYTDWLTCRNLVNIFRFCPDWLVSRDNGDSREERKRYRIPETDSGLHIAWSSQGSEVITLLIWLFFYFFLTLYSGHYRPAEDLDEMPLLKQGPPKAPGAVSGDFSKGGQRLDTAVPLQCLFSYSVRKALLAVF